MGKEESTGNSLEAGKSRGSFSGKLGYRPPQVCKDCERA